MHPMARAAHLISTLAIAVVVLVVAGAVAAPLRTHATLTASPSIITENPGVVTLTWSGLEHHNSSYIIGIFGPFPSTEQLTEHGYVQVEGTSGTATVAVVDIRGAYRFSLCV
jgi:hypothetical protein